MSNLDFEQRHRLETEVLPAVVGDPEYAAATIVRLEAERDRLREALRWYEIRARLMVKPTVSGNSAVYELENDAGKKARVALQREGE
jgi:hypothetical protein